MTCCECHGIDCAQGRDCPCRAEGDESMQMLAFLLIVAACIALGIAWYALPIPLE